jgi:hypothetical protein
MRRTATLSGGSYSASHPRLWRAPRELCGPVRNIQSRGESCIFGRKTLVNLEAFLKIATFNVDSVDVVLRWLAESKQGCPCLRELNARAQSDFQKLPFAKGYGAIWHGQKSRNGVAVLARGLDLVESVEAFPATQMVDRRYIEALLVGRW